MTYRIIKIILYYSHKKWMNKIKVWFTDLRRDIFNYLKFYTNRVHRQTKWKCLICHVVKPNTIALLKCKEFIIFLNFIDGCFPLRHNTEDARKKVICNFKMYLYQKLDISINSYLFIYPFKDKGFHLQFHFNLSFGRL